MRQFRVNLKRRVKYIKILKETAKAYLILIEPKIIIWVPKYMIDGFPTKKIFEVPDKYASEIRMKILVEKSELK
tara:strand:+ start:442 stop:663 length:222 start_codon:yes stop_codon:yes gene_type:complete